MTTFDSSPWPDAERSASYRLAETLLERLVEISSPTGDRRGLERATTVYASALENVGLTTTIETDDDGLPVLHAASSRAGDDGYLLAIGHLDTVLPAATPRKERVDGALRLVATGAADMKGGLAALVGALDLLRRSGRQGGDDLRVAVVPDEEIAGPITHEVVRALGPRASILWSLEPGRILRTADGDDGSIEESIVLGRRGRFSWTLDVRGRGAHAGTSFWEGRSALGAAAAWWAEAETLARPGDGPTINAGRMVAGERDFVESLPRHADLLFSKRQINVVPDRTRLEGEARFRRVEDGAAMRESLERSAATIAAARQVELDLWIGDESPPLEPSPTARRWAEIATERAAERGWRLSVEEDRGGLSFPNFLEDPSAVPSLDGLGPAGGGLHTRDEWVDLGSLHHRVVLLADLLEELTRRGS